MHLIVVGAHQRGLLLGIPYIGVQLLQVDRNPSHHHLAQHHDRQENVGRLRTQSYVQDVDAHYANREEDSIHAECLHFAWEYLGDEPTGVGLQEGLGHSPPERGHEAQREGLGEIRDEGHEGCHLHEQGADDGKLELVELLGKPVHQQSSHHLTYSQGDEHHPLGEVDSVVEVVLRLSLIRH